jgi:hypothetical protein
MARDLAHEKRIGDGLVAAGVSLGLKSAKYKKEVSKSWQLQPLAGLAAALPEWTQGCVVGTWQGRRASATIQLPRGGKLSGGLWDKMVDWSEGQLLITSVGFVSGVIPFMVGAPTAPFRINEKKTYTWENWVPGFGMTEYGTEVPVPGDANGAWVVRAIQTERPAAVTAAIAPMLLSEPAYPWRIDGGKKGSHEVDLVRVDLALPDTPPPTGEFLAGRFERLSQMAAVIETSWTTDSIEGRSDLRTDPQCVTHQRYLASR